MKAVEHPAGADGRELARVADQHERRTVLLDGGHESAQALGVAHARLVHVGGGCWVDVPAAVLQRRYEAVECPHASLEGRGVLAETLCGPPGDRHADHRASGLQLGPGGGVDDHALARAGLADEHGGALGAGEGRDCGPLLDRQRAGDPLLGRADRSLDGVRRDDPALTAREGIEVVLEPGLQGAHPGGRERAVGQLDDAALVA